jgi:predicted O-methyltransferase YrrM
MRVKVLPWSITAVDMDVSLPERSPRWPLQLQAALAGAALGVLAMTGGGVFLGDAEGLLAAAAGVVVTVVAALAVGVWAGAPDAAEPEPPLRGRWFAAGLMTGAAGVFASLWEAFPAETGGALGRAFALLLLVAAPVYTLGLLLPTLLAWGERWEEGVADAADDEEEPSRWEPLGSLLLPLLGAFAAAVALTGVVLGPYIGPGPVLLATGAALILPTVLPEPEQPRTEERTVFATESPLGTIRVVEFVYPGRRQPERRLYINDEEESGEQVRSGAPTLAYIAAAEQWFGEFARRGESYLFLGGGAYTLPRRIAERDPRARITVVELDPEVTRVAYRFFGLTREHGIHSVHGDARAYVERAGDGRYDRIFVDVYGGSEMLPYSLVTAEAFGAIARLLRPGGVMAINAIGVTEGVGARRLWSIVRTVAEVFPSVALYTHLGRDYPERQNVLLAGSLDPDHSFPPAAGRFEPWPLEEWPDLSEAAVFRDLGEEAPAGERRERVDRAAGR